MVSLCFVLSSLMLCVLAALLLGFFPVDFAGADIVLERFDPTRICDRYEICKWRVYYPLQYNEDGSREFNYNLIYCDCTPVGKCRFQRYYLPQSYDIFICYPPTRPPTSRTEPTISITTTAEIASEQVST